jgi:long-chain fatty acid transport protein
LTKSAKFCTRVGRKIKEEDMRKRIASICILLFLSVSSLSAGGWNNTLMGIRALGIGAAFVGIADDPSGIYYNPAGLILQEQKFNFSVNGIYIMPTHQYTVENIVSAQSQKKSGIPQFFITYKASERMTLGFGIFVPYAGGGVDWSADDLGQAMSSHLGVISYTPSISLRISDKFSLGVNINFYKGVFELNADTELMSALKSEESGSSLSASLGLMYEPSNRWRFGLSIRGPAKMTLSGNTLYTVSVPNVGDVRFGSDSETKFNLPWDIEFGFMYKFSDRFILSTSAQYTLWSTLDKVTKTFKDIPGVGDLDEVEEMNFKDILIMRVGLEYVIPAGIFLRGGIGLDRAATPPEYLSINNIDVDKITLLGGIGYRSGNMEINFVYIYAGGKETERINTDYGFPLTEAYNLNASIFGLGVTFSF